MTMKDFVCDLQSRFGVGAIILDRCAHSDIPLVRKIWPKLMDSPLSDETAEALAMAACQEISMHLTTLRSTEEFRTACGGGHEFLHRMLAVAAARGVVVDFSISILPFLPVEKMILDGHTTVEEIIGSASPGRSSSRSSGDEPA